MSKIISVLKYNPSSPDGPHNRIGKTTYTKASVLICSLRSRKWSKYANHAQHNNIIVSNLPTPDRFRSRRKYYIGIVIFGGSFYFTFIVFKNDVIYFTDYQSPFSPHHRTHNHLG